MAAPPAGAGGGAAASLDSSRFVDAGSEQDRCLKIAFAGMSLAAIDADVAGMFAPAQVSGAVDILRQLVG
jgi:hypothetical protein